MLEHSVDGCCGRWAFDRSLCGWIVVTTDCLCADWHECVLERDVLGTQVWWIYKQNNELWKKGSELWVCAALGQVLILWIKHDTKQCRNKLCASSHQTHTHTGSLRHSLKNTKHNFNERTLCIFTYILILTMRQVSTLALAFLFASIYKCEHTHTHTKICKYGCAWVLAWCTAWVSRLSNWEQARWSRFWPLGRS